MNSHYANPVFVCISNAFAHFSYFDVKCIESCNYIVLDYIQ